MYSFVPTIRSRELGERLRLATENAGMNGRQLAVSLGWSEPKLSRIFTGKRESCLPDVAAILALCKITGAAKADIMQLCATATVQNWWQHYGTRLPAHIPVLARHQDTAQAIHDYQPLVLPDMLHTAAYTRALLHRSAVPADEIDHHIAVRKQRKELFTAYYGPTWTFYLHENTLRLPVADHETMSSQLHHLLRMSVRDNISLRVIPNHADKPLTTTPFTLMQAPHYGAVVCLLTETTAQFLETKDHLNTYHAILSHLATAALNDTDTRKLISTVATTSYPAPHNEQSDITATHT